MTTPRPRINTFQLLGIFVLEIIFGTILRFIAGHDDTNAWLLGCVYGGIIAPLNLYLISIAFPNL